jgi:type I restriction enzyme M protein
MVQNEIVQKLWNLCHILRDSGINYPDYVSELALLLFIKIEDANFASGLLQKHRLPKEAQWGSLIAANAYIKEQTNDYADLPLKDQKFQP